jgi:two-component system sensor histidine kinase CiaH
MQFRGLIHFLKSSTASLGGTYLLIIMAMSIGFSLVFYNTSSNALGRQLPPDSLIHQQQVYDDNPQSTGSISSGPSTAAGQSAQGTYTTQHPLDDYLQQRINEGRSSLMHRLVYLNIGALIVGAALSYALARRSLQPIEAAMEAQAQFVSDASHELRTPLTAIQTSNEVFLRRPKPTLGDAKSLIQQNSQDITRLKHLTDGLLKLSQESKTGSVKFAPQHLQDIVSDALTQVVPQASLKNIAVHDETPDLKTLGDHALLTQALVILLDNAVKYSNTDGNVYVSANAKSKYAYLTVRDEGIGIRASDMPHLFRRFYRADNARTGGERAGYGLGLSIAKQIVDNHHGHIDVASTPGKGSSFTLKLPLA